MDWRREVQISIFHGGKCFDLQKETIDKGKWTSPLRIIYVLAVGVVLV